MIIKKAGTAGFENSEPVIIQGHLDMVCEKTDDSAHNFDTDPIEVYEENGFLKAKDTSLGETTELPSHMHLQFLTVTRLNIRRLKQSLPQMKKLEWVAQEQSIFLY